VRTITSLQNGRIFYRVSWKDRDLIESSWIEENQIPDQQLIQKYERKLRKGKQPAGDDELDETEYHVRHKYQPFTIDIPSRKF